MGKLIQGLNVSLDGFVETPDHGLDLGRRRSCGRWSRTSRSPREIEQACRLCGCITLIRTGPSPASYDVRMTSISAACVASSIHRRRRIRTD
jgi:hypothetical protein